MAQGGVRVKMSARVHAATPTVPPGGRPRWDHARLSGAAVLGAWSILFWFLLMTGRVSLYLGARTSWIAPVGAIILGAACVGLLTTARGESGRVTSRRDAAVAALLIVPVVVVLASPRAALGTFSASRKTEFSGAGLWTYWGTFDESSQITLLFVTAAKYWPEAGALLSRRAGSDVAFIGFVDRDSSSAPDEFMLRRFVVTCCVADAAIVGVRVVDVAPGQVATGDWVQVRGRIYPVGNQIIVTAVSIEPVDTPEDPYLYA